MKKTKHYEETYSIKIEYIKDDDLRIMSVSFVELKSMISMHFETRDEAVKASLYYVAQYMKHKD